MKFLAIFLIVIGIASLAYGGFTYTTRKRAVDLGPLQIDKKTQHSVPLPPIVGVSAIILGGGILLMSKGR